MNLVTTPTGNTGRHVLHAAVDAGAATRVFVRDPGRLDPADRAAVEVVTGDLRDPHTLRTALDGIDTAFFCVPQSADAADVGDYYRSFSEPFAAAAAAAGVRRVVTISGGDEDDDAGGPGAALRDTERVIDAAVAHTGHIRCGYFMENLLWQAESIAYGSRFFLPIDRDVPLAWVAAGDIGAVAGRYLLDPDWTGRVITEAYGPAKVTCDEAAKLLSVALERDVTYVAAEPDAWVADLVRYGVGPAMAASLRDMFVEISRGRDMGRAPDNPADCPTTLPQWATVALKPAVDRITPSVPESH